MGKESLCQRRRKRKDFSRKGAKGRRKGAKKGFSSSLRLCVFPLRLCVKPASRPNTPLKCIFRHMRLHPPIFYLDAARNGSKQSDRKECRNARPYPFQIHAFCSRDNARRGFNNVRAGTVAGSTQR